MPTESIVFSPEISDRDLDREVAGVNDRLDEAASGITADFDADMDALTPPGGGGGSGLATGAGGTSLLALAENRNDILVDIRESLAEDFVGDDGGGGGVSSILMGALGLGGGGPAAAAGAGAAGLAAAGGFFFSSLTDEQLQQTPDAEDTTGGRDDTPPEGGTPLGEAGWPELPEELKGLMNLKWPEVPGAITNLLQWSFPVIPDTIDALTSLEWPSMPDWMSPLSVDWPGMPSWMDAPQIEWSTPKWVQRLFDQNRITGGEPPGDFEGEHFGRPSNRGAAIQQNQSGQQGGGPMSVDVDAPLQVDPDRIVRDIARELEPLVERELNDLRDEITRGAGDLI